MYVSQVFSALYINHCYHSGSYPVAINRDVSPLGNHSLTIYVEDDEGFLAETTVAYFLEEDLKPTGYIANPYKSDMCCTMSCMLLLYAPK